MEIKTNKFQCNFSTLILLITFKKQCELNLKITNFFCVEFWMCCTRDQLSKISGAQPKQNTRDHTLQKFM